MHTFDQLLIFQVDLTYFSLAWNEMEFVEIFSELWQTYERNFAVTEDDFLNSGLIYQVNFI